MFKRKMMTLAALSLMLCLMAAGGEAARYRVLRPGDTGREVISLQQALQYLQYPIVPDGKYGAATEQAVRAFQMSRGLHADGKAGDKTLGELYRLAPQFDIGGSAPNPSPATPVPNGGNAPEGAVPRGKYREGDEVAAVREIQQRLIDLGYPVAKADAVYGRGTKNAVTLFQRTNGLNADGVAGQGTLNRLFSSSAIRYAGTPQATPAPGVTFAPQATAAPQFQPAPGKARVVTANRGSLNLRAAPANGKNIVGKLPYMAEVEVLSGDARWSQVRYGGLSGYVMTRYLSPINAAPSPQTTLAPQATAVPVPTEVPQNPQTRPQGAPTHRGYVNTAGTRRLNFRSAPHTDRTMIGEIPHGTTLDVYEAGPTWCRVFYNGRMGYVMTSFLKLEPIGGLAQPEEAPKTAPPAQATEAPPARILRLGMRGDDVLAAQKRLKALKYSCPENSVYDAETRDAVVQFQSLNGLKADGALGAQTAGVLFSSGAAEYGSQPQSYSALRIDNKDGSGQLVTMLQKRLKELGFSLKINGVFDVATHQAVVGFQQRNGLTVSGAADTATQRVLYASGAKGASTPVDSLPEDAGKGQGVSAGSVKLLHWFKDIKPAIRSGQTAQVYHPASGISFTVRFYSLGRHCDAEPQTFRDTRLMNRAFGSPSWNCNVVYVKLPSGAWTIASMHNRPHLYGGINNNGFSGHLCIHFLRDMEETQRNDPNYGVTNQKTIRNAWQRMTGQSIDY